MSRTALLATVAALLAATPVLADDTKPADQDRTCFLARSINGYSTVDADTVRITVGAREQYDLTLFSKESGLRFENSLGVRTRGSSWVCSPRDIEIVGDLAAGRIPVKAITRVAPDTKDTDRAAG